MAGCLLSASNLLVKHYGLHSLAYFTGFCFQYNGDGAFNSSSPGKTGGIQVTLDANVAEYATGPNSMSEGFSVIFNSCCRFIQSVIISMYGKTTLSCPHVIIHHLFPSMKKQPLFTI